MRIIVNADDVGSSHRVNDAAFRLIASGAIRSASILANAGAFEDAARRAREFPECSFGVHLNITSGPPLGPATGLEPLLDEQGHFKREIAFSTMSARRVRHAVRDQWCRQVDRLAASGLKVSHIDSHHHVHIAPVLFGVLKKVQRKFGIERVRIPMNVGGGSSRAHIINRAARSAWARAVRLDGTKTTRYCGPLAKYCQWIRQTPRTDDPTVETTVHPGREKFIAETALLDSDWWRQHIAANRVISYWEL